MGPDGGAFAFANSRKRAWLTALTMAIVAGGGAADPGALAQSAVRTSFDVPAGPLSRALAAFGRQAGLQVTYLTAICAGKTSPGLSGPATPEDALAHILRGTGLTYSFPNSTTVAISEPSASAGPVDADGPLPDTIGITAAIQAALATRGGRVATSARPAHAERQTLIQISGPGVVPICPENAFRGT